MVAYTGFQFQPGTTVYYSFGVHAFWSNAYGNQIDSITTAAYQNYTISAINTWSSQLNISFAYTANAANADLTINWGLIDGYGNVLGAQQSYDPNGNGIVSGNGEGLSAIFMDIYDYRDFSGVIKHELGHALGLSHYGTSSRLMYPYYSGQEITQRDIADAAELYGYNSTGSNSNDHFSGSSRSDIYRASGGNDVVSGLGGNDILYGNVGLDSILGGSGDDTLYGGQNSGSLSGNPGAYRSGIEYVWGGDDKDLIYGNHGTDVLMGQAGNDTLYGGQDADGLQGGYGDDRLYGNLGADSFYYNFFGEGNEGNDSIYGFSASHGDQILLTNATVTSHTATNYGTDIILSTGTKISLVGIYDYAEVTVTV